MRTRLEEIMSDKGVGSTELASKSGLTRDTIEKLKSGRSNYSERSRRLVASALNIKQSELLDPEDVINQGLDLEALSLAENIAKDIISKEKSAPEIKTIRQFIKTLYDIIIKEKQQQENQNISETVAKELWRLHANK
jgi:transcriptional regulator with XRE-family HTH domain